MNNKNKINCLAVPIFLEGTVFQLVHVVRDETIKCRRAHAHDMSMYLFTKIFICKVPYSIVDNKVGDKKLS